MNNKFHSTEEIIKLSLIRSISFNNFENLIKSNSKLNKLSLIKLEEEISDCLIKLLFESPIPISPTLLNYLNQSISFNSQSIPPLIRIPYLTKRLLLFNPSLSLKALNEIFLLILNSNQLQQDHSINSNLNSNLSLSTTLPFLFESIDELLQAITFTSNLLISITNQKELNENLSILTWLIKFYSHPSIIISPTSLINATPKILNESIQAVDNTLLHLTTNSFALLNPILIQLSTLIPILPRTIGTSQTLNLNDTSNSSTSTTTTTVQSFMPPIELRNSLDSAEPDITFLISDLLNVKSSPTGISNLLHSSNRFKALLQTRLNELESTPYLMIKIALGEILMAFYDIGLISFGNGEEGLKALVFRLPEILRVVFDSDGFEILTSTGGLTKAFEEALSGFKIRILNGTNNLIPLEKNQIIFENLIFNSYQLELISKEFITSIGSDLITFNRVSLIGSVENINLEEDQIQLTLKTLLLPTSNLIDSHTIPIRLLIDALQSTIENYSQSFNLTGLAYISTALLENSNYLNHFFFFLEPKLILIPIRIFLDCIDTTIRDSFGEGHAVEKYGIVAHFLLIVMSRFKLYNNSSYHLGTSEGFIFNWIVSLSSVYPLNSFESYPSHVINNWIRDLFGEGISDELMQSTDPRILLTVAPTICKQSLTACQMGVIDIETLREGLSYLLHDILSFTLPGVLLWLIGEIGRTVISPNQSIMVDILQLFIFAETLPKTVLELISFELNLLVIKFDSLIISTSISTSTLDLKKIEFLIKPFISTNSDNSIQPQLPSQMTWLQKLNHEIISTLDPISTQSPNISISIHHSLKQFSLHSILKIIINTLLNGTRILFLPTTTTTTTTTGTSFSEGRNFNPNEWIRNGRIRKLGRSLISLNTFNGIGLRFNLLEFGVKEFLIEFSLSLLPLSIPITLPGGIGSGSGGIRIKIEGLEKVKLEMMILIWIEAFQEAEILENLFLFNSSLNHHGQGQGSSRVVLLKQELVEKLLKIKATSGGESGNGNDGIQTGFEFFIEGMLKGLKGRKLDVEAEAEEEEVMNVE